MSDIITLVKLYPRRAITIIGRISEGHPVIAYSSYDRLDKEQAVVNQAINFTEAVFIASQAGKFFAALVGLI